MAPSSFQSLQESANSAALVLLKSGPSVVQNMQGSFGQLFPSESLSATRTKFVSSAASDSGVLLENPSVEACYTTTLDVTDTTQHMLAVLDHYIRLTIPKMEDGNNFGVTVQLAALKQINDAQEKLSKAIDDVIKYTSSRADAIEKCKLPTENTTTTKTSSQSSSKVTGDEPKNASDEKSSTEEKTTLMKYPAGIPESKLRTYAVVDIDILYYTKCKSLFRTCMTEYITALDFLEKNQDKIQKPRGSRGEGSSAFSSMY